MKLNFKKLDMSERKGEIQKKLSIQGPVLNIDTGENLNKNKADHIIQLINENMPKMKADIEKYIRYSNMSFIHDKKLGINTWIYSISLF